MCNTRTNCDFQFRMLTVRLNDCGIENPETKLVSEVRKIQFEHNRSSFRGHWVYFQFQVNIKLNTVASEMGP